MKLQPAKALCAFIIAVGILNFVAYGVAATCLGGDAINGRAENGHYFLSSHGKQTEVSEVVFNYSRIHTYAVWITHPLAILSGWILSSLDRKTRAGKDRGLKFEI